MDWKISLDRYLTSPPDDNFDSWIEDLIENKFTDDFYNSNEDWILDDNGLCIKWIEKLFYKEKTKQEASEIIERAYKFFKIK